MIALIKFQNFFYKVILSESFGSREFQSRTKWSWSKGNYFLKFVLERGRKIWK